MIKIKNSISCFNNKQNLMKNLGLVRKMNLKLLGSNQFFLSQKIQSNLKYNKETKYEVIGSFYSNKSKIIQSQFKIINKNQSKNIHLKNMVESDKPSHKNFITTAQDTEELVKKKGIFYHLQSHPIVMTSEELAKIECTKKELDFLFAKNMIFKTKSGKFVFYMLPGDQRADIKLIEKFSGEKNLRGADDSVLNNYLNVKKGAVTPFCLLNLTDEWKQKFVVIIDDRLNAKEYTAVHPMVNDHTMWLLLKDILSILTEHQIDYKTFNLEKFQKEQEEKNTKETKEKEKDKPKEEDEKHKLAIKNKKIENTFSDWYSEVITKSEMIEYYDVSGCYILRPWAYEIWENIQKFFDERIKSVGVKNCYFPMFVSQDCLEKEKDHVAGFSPEVAWVTHYGDKQLEKKVAIRPTSETIMYPVFSKWINSHRDLPMLMNQWCNVVRWEFRNPTPFIRTREFLWQEGHSVHETEEGAEDFMLTILEFYRQVFEELLAIPVIKGMKSENEKFAGALRTSSIETMITSNGKAIQCATSHNLGQNFAKMFDIKFLDKNQKFQYAWQESWGLSTRSIGALVMVHGDNDGLKLPPRVAPVQVVLVPIVTSSDKTGSITKKLKEIADDLAKRGVRIKLDDSDVHNPGWKYNFWELKGVPLRIEFGQKDMEKNQVTLVPRDTKVKETCLIEKVTDTCVELLEAIQKRMYEAASKAFSEQRGEANDFESFSKLLNARNCILAPWCTDPKCEDTVKEKVKELSELGEENAGTVKTLNVPLEQKEMTGNEKCFNCGNPAKKYALWGRSY